MAEADYNRDVVIDMIGRDIYNEYHASYVALQIAFPLTYSMLCILLRDAGVINYSMWARRIIDDAKMLLNAARMEARRHEQ